MRVRARRRDIGPDSKICKFSGNSEAVNQPALPLSWGGFTCGSAGGPRHIQPSPNTPGGWPGLTRAAEERGPLPPVSEFCRSRGFLGYGWALTQRLLREPDGFSIGRQKIDLTPRRMDPDATPGLEPAMRCWEILTVAPQRRCLDSDMRLESCRRHDRTSQITWPR